MILALIAFVVWVIFLILLKKLKMAFFVFLFGSIGLFFFLMYLGTGGFEKYLEYCVTYVLYLIGKVTHLFTAYPQYSSMTVYYNTQAISFFVDYECSGIVESLVYLCLLVFYPLYSYKLKVVFGSIGVVYIFLANILRVFFIGVIAKIFGPSMFFFSHTIFARLLFFILMIILYYIVFTKPHIIKQKVGELKYGDK